VQVSVVGVLCVKQDVHIVFIVFTESKEKA